MAYAAMADFNFHIPGIQVAGGVAEFFEWGLGLLRGVAIDIHLKGLLCSG